MLSLVISNFEKYEKACTLVKDSLDHLPFLEPEILNHPRSLEPFDALSGRFERTVEVALNKLFRSLELHETGAQSETIRDRLNAMVKMSLISNVELWLEMREFRNRIAHDYLPEQLMSLFAAIRDRFSSELLKTLDAAKSRIASYQAMESSRV